MRRTRLLAGAVALLLMTTLFLDTIYVSGTEAPLTYVVLVDLSHGQDPRGLDLFVKILYDGRVVVLLRDYNETSRLDPIVRSMVEIVYGSLDNMRDSENRSVSLDTLGVDIVVLPGLGPGARLTDTEVSVLKRFLERGGRGLWVSTTDYIYSTPGLLTEINSLLYRLGSGLVIDNVSLRDPVNNLGRQDIVSGLVAPTPGVGVLRYGVEKVALYRPLPIVIRNTTTGSLEPLTYETIKNTSIEIIVVTSDKTQVSGPVPGATGSLYNETSRGPFTVVALESVKSLNNSIVVVSGAPLLGGDAPLVSARYGGYWLGGPILVRNIVLWATGYMGELRIYRQLDEKIDRSLENLISSINEIGRELNILTENTTTRLTSLESTVSEYNQKINEAKMRAENLSAVVARLYENISRLEPGVSATGSYAVTALALSIVSLVVSVILVLLTLRKRTQA